jgi:ureidoglycolate lyase
MQVKVQMLNSNSFAPYGEVLEPQECSPAIAEPLIDFWPGVSNIETTSNFAQLNWLEIKMPRPFISESVEHHVFTTEALIPVSGQSIVLFGLSEDMDSTDSSIDYSTFAAFIIDGSKAVNLKKGVWHDLPFLLSEKAQFIVIFEKHTIENDLQVVKLKESIEIIL